MRRKPFLCLFLCACISDDSRTLPSPDAGVTADARVRPDAGPPPPTSQLIQLAQAELAFAVVGDTRPAVEDDTAAYPTAVIAAIFDRVQAESPALPFAVSTGDYMWASTSGDEQGPQLDAYLGARDHYDGRLFPALGNHECTGATASNCVGFTTKNFDMFTRRLLNPSGASKPWYMVRVDPPSGAWSAKIVFIAANAWASEQASWLEDAMATPTTYTFVVRHEGSYVDEAPGVNPSQTIIDRHPYTLLIVGHNHKYSREGQREVIIGNGGAPLNNSKYGYAVVRRRDDGNVALTAYASADRSVLDAFVLKPDGSNP